MGHNIVKDNKNTENERSFSVSKRIIFYFIMFIIMAICTEVALRVIYYQIEGNKPIAILQAYDKLLQIISDKIGSKDIIYQKSLYRDDPWLGYGMVPGEHHIVMEVKYPLVKLRHHFSILIGKDGYRTTSDISRDYEGKPEIWIFGCSWTFGWPLDNKYSYPWLIQEKITNYCIRNLAINGYANTHALLQLKEEIRRGSRPVIAIFVYNPFHLERNVAGSTFINAISNHNKELLKPRYPRAFINENSKVEIELLALKNINVPDRTMTLAYMKRVTIEIFKELKEICDENAIIPVVAVQFGKEFDQVLLSCRQMGFIIADLRIHLDSSYKKFPFDNHPNERAHKKFAQKLLAYLNPLVNELQKREKAISLGRIKQVK